MRFTLAGIVLALIDLDYRVCSTMLEHQIPELLVHTPVRIQLFSIS